MRLGVRVVARGREGDQHGCGGGGGAVGIEKYSPKEQHFTASFCIRAAGQKDAS